MWLDLNHPLSYRTHGFFGFFKVTIQVILHSSKYWMMSSPTRGASCWVVSGVTTWLWETQRQDDVKKYTLGWVYGDSTSIIVREEAKLVQCFLSFSGEELLQISMNVTLKIQSLGWSPTTKETLYYKVQLALFYKWDILSLGIALSEETKALYFYLSLSREHPAHNSLPMLNWAVFSRACTVT